MEYTVKLDINTEAVSQRLLEGLAVGLNTNINCFLQQRFGNFPQLTRKEEEAPVQSTLQVNPHFQTTGRTLGGRFGAAPMDHPAGQYVDPPLPSVIDTKAPETILTPESVTETPVTEAVTAKETPRFMDVEEVVKELMDDEYISNKMKDILHRKITSFIASHDL